MTAAVFGLEHSAPRMVGRKFGVAFVARDSATYSRTCNCTRFAVIENNQRKSNRGPGRWKPGESGNPSGKPPGSGELQRLRAAIGEHVPEIINQLVTAARGGDIQAARLILERVLPPVKAIEQAQAINLPDGSLTAQGRAVLAAVAAGELAPGQGAALLGALGTLAKLTEADELTARIEALEARNVTGDTKP